MKVTSEWEQYPELFTWVEEMKSWVQEYGIHKFVHADDAGLDPTEQSLKQIPNWSGPTKTNPLPLFLEWETSIYGGCLAGILPPIHTPAT